MTAQARRDVFQAIADPTRRQIISLLATGAMNVNAISERFDMSRPAISQHVKILEECGLLVITQQGRERLCEARLEALTDVARWVGQYSQFWNQKLDALDAFLKKSQSPKHTAKTKKPSSKHK